MEHAGAKATRLKSPPRKTAGLPGHAQAGGALGPGLPGAMGAGIGAMGMLSPQVLPQPACAIRKCPHLVPLNRLERPSGEFNCARSLQAPLQPTGALAEALSTASLCMHTVHCCRMLQLPVPPNGASPAQNGGMALGWQAEMLAGARSRARCRVSAARSSPHVMSSMLSQTIPEEVTLGLDT